MDNYFHIHVPIFGVEKIYGWKNEIGVGLAKYKIDKLAQEDATIVVRIGKSPKEYTIKAYKVQMYPLHKVPNSRVECYVVKKSALNPRSPKTSIEKEKEEYFKYLA